MAFVTKLDDSKHSVTGWFDDYHEVARFKNLVKTQVESRQYFSDWGLDWDTWQSPDMEFGIGSLSSYIIQQATLQAIIVLDMDISIKNFTLLCDAQVQNLKASATSSGSTYFGI